MNMNKYEHYGSDISSINSCINLDSNSMLYIIVNSIDFGLLYWSDKTRNQLVDGLFSLF